MCLSLVIHAVFVCTQEKNRKGKTEEKESEKERKNRTRRKREKCEKFKWIMRKMKECIMIRFRVYF